VQQVILWPCIWDIKNYLVSAASVFLKGSKIEATDTYFPCRPRPKRVGSALTNQLGDLVCHQMYFAASAIRPPTAMANTAICTQILFAKPLVFLICVFIAGLPPFGR
jgi:hypothetical protein